MFVEIRQEGKIHETQQFILTKQIEQENIHYVHSELPLSINDETESSSYSTSTMIEENVKRKNKTNVSFQQNEKLYNNHRLSIAMSAKDSKHLQKLKMDM